jgi:hypothetical protein
LLTPTVDAPVVGRPSAHFYGAIGEQVRVEMKASPVELRVEDPLVLTLLITGATNPERIERPDLHQLPEFAQRFHIDDLPEDAPPQGQRVFRYGLRPKTERVRDVPPLLFHYWNPRLNYFATTVTREAIALRLAPRETPAVTGPLDEPDFLFEMSSDNALKLRALSDDWQVALLMLALFVPPLLFEAWFLVWKRMNPSAARLAQMRRSHALRVALDRLEDISRFGPRELADEVDAVIRDYLRERFGIAGQAGTAREISGELTRRGVPPRIVADVDAFYRACDEVRFGPSTPDHESLLEIAKQLVLNAEDAK